MAWQHQEAPAAAGCLAAWLAVPAQAGWEALERLQGTLVAAGPGREGRAAVALHRCCCSGLAGGWWHRLRPQGELEGRVRLAAPAWAAWQIQVALGGEGHRPVPPPGPLF